MSKQYTFVIDEEKSKMRLDKALVDLLPEYSRSYIQQLISDGSNILVNQSEVKSNYKTKCGDYIHITIPDPVMISLDPENIPLNILYEDRDLLIVDKPKGMVVHPSQGHGSGTLVHALLYHCKDSLSSINGELRPGIVHRIDMDTTGLLVVCKNDYAHQDLAEQLKCHSITRRYQCLVHDNIESDTGTVNQPIGRHRTDRKKQAIDVTGGRRAVTHYRVLGRYHTGKDSITHVECELETGRTHQIRVHMASIHHPLLGDQLYGRGEEKYLGIPLQGQVLHAGTLGFIHPRTKEYMEFHSELPDYFQELLLKLQQLK